MDCQIQNQNIKSEKNKMTWNDRKADWFKEYQKKPYICDCGKKINKGSLYYHMKTKDHQIYLLKKQISEKN